MKKQFVVSICFLFFFICHSSKAQIAIQWQKTFGGIQADFGDCIQQTTDGGYIMLGSSRSSNGHAWGNHGGSDFWVVKLDAAGDTLWTKCYGGSSNESTNFVEQTSDGGYILSGLTSSTNGDVTGFHGGGGDFWIVKIDGSGNILWQKCLGGSGDEISATSRQTSDGGYIVTGSSNSTDFDVTGNHGGFDAWVVKLDGSGGIDWSYCYGGIGVEGFSSVDQTSDGGFILAGRADYNDGDVSSCHGQYDFWTVKLNSAGVLQWQKCHGGGFVDEASYIMKTADQGFIVTGWTGSNDGDVSGYHGGYDGWVVKLDSTGNIQWQNSLGGTGTDAGFIVKQVADGGYIFAGETESVNIQATGNKGYIDAWIVKVDAAGNYVWHQCLGGTSFDHFSSFWQTADGNYIMSGFTFSLNGDINTNLGDRDAWIVRLSEDFNLITGKTFVDLNSNSIKDAGESAIPSVKINLNGPSNFNFTDQVGNYAFPVIAPGTYTTAPDSISYYNSIPLVQTVTFSGINQIDSLNDFAFQPAGTFNDLSVAITQYGMFRPGYDASFIISYKNKGNTTLIPTVIFFPDTSMDFVSAVPVQSAVSPDSITWNLSSLAPYESASILVTVHLDSTLISGSMVVSEAVILPGINDATPADNIEIQQTYVYSSFDPNFISVSRDTMLSTEFPNPGYLEYLVCFQNTGNDTALNVVVLNNMQMELDETAFELVATSHPVTINYAPHSRKFSYAFNNIMLPDSTTNETASHGFLRYRIKPVSTLASGDRIENTAAIYFDFNQPVVTNTALTEIVLPSGIGEQPGMDTPHLAAYPNPFRDEFNIEIRKMEGQKIAVKLFDVYGRLIENIYNGNATNEKLIINNKYNSRAAGIYFVRLESVRGVEILKIIKH